MDQNAPLSRAGSGPGTWPPGNMDVDKDVVRGLEERWLDMLDQLDMSYIKIPRDSLRCIRAADGLNNKPKNINYSSNSSSNKDMYAMVRSACISPLIYI